MRCRDTRTSFGDQLFKHALTQISKNCARRFVGVFGYLFFDLWIDVAGGHEQVGIAVVIEVDDSGAPADVASFDAEARGCGGVLKVGLAIVAIKNVAIVGEMGFEN